MHMYVCMHACMYVGIYMESIHTHFLASTAALLNGNLGFLFYLQYEAHYPSDG